MSFSDRTGMDHSVLVMACSRNEAVIRAAAVFEQNGFAHAMTGLYSIDRVSVRVITTEAEASIAEARAWLERLGNDPAEAKLNTKASTQHVRPSGIGPRAGFVPL